MYVRDKNYSSSSKTGHLLVNNKGRSNKAEKYLGTMLKVCNLV